MVAIEFYVLFARAPWTFIWTDWKPMWPIKNTSEDGSHRPELKAGAAPSELDRTVSRFYGDVNLV